MVSLTEIITRVCKAESPPFRPNVNVGNDEVDPAMIQVMHDCWKEDPDLRPDFKQIKSMIRQMSRGRYAFHFGSGMIITGCPFQHRQSHGPCPQNDGEIRRKS